MHCELCKKEEKRKKMVKAKDEFGAFAICHEKCAEESGIPLKWKKNK